MFSLCVGCRVRCIVPAAMRVAVALHLWVRCALRPSFKPERGAERLRVWAVRNPWATIMGSCGRTLFSWRTARVAESRGGCRGVLFLALSYVVLTVRRKRPRGISPRGIPMYSVISLNRTLLGAKLLASVTHSFTTRIYVT